MWKPDWIKVVNLMSHSESTFPFVDGRVVMIKGKNEYDRLPKSNGAGKSVLLEAASIAFTGDFIRKIGTPDMIKDGAASADVEFQMHNTMTNEVIYIKRTIYRSTSKYARLTINLSGQPVEFAKVDHGTDWLLKKIGITKEDLFNYYIISKKKYKSFFYSTDGDKRKLISRFSSADMVEGVYAEISEDVKNIDDNIKNLDADKNIINGRITVYEEQLTEGTDDLTDQELIDSLNESINLKSDEIVLIEERITASKKELIPLGLDQKDLQKNIDTANIALSKIKPKDYKSEKDALSRKKGALSVQIEDFEADMDLANDVIVEINGKIQPLDKKISDLDKKLVDFISCPKCAHQFSFKDAKLDIKAINKEKKSLELSISEFNVDIANARQIIVDVQKSIDAVQLKLDAVNVDIRALAQKETDDSIAINSKKREISANEAKLSSLNTRITIINNSIKSNGSSITSIKESIARMEAEILDINNNDEEKEDPKKAINVKIEMAKEDLTKIDEKVLMLNKDKASKLKWNELYKRFNVKLSNMAIKSIEGLSNSIQLKMDSNLQLSIEGYKVKRDGSINDQITAQVLRYGVLEGTFFRFSEGEQGSLNISATMAMQQLINMGCPAGGMDITIIDEITESLDSAAMASVVKSLDLLGRTIMIITHVSDEAMIIPNEMTIVKTSEGSKII